MDYSRRKDDPTRMTEGKLFVGGLSWETTNDSLRDYFEKYGEVIDCIVMREALSGRSRGFGFVTFAEVSACDKAVTEKHVVDGKSIDAKLAVPRDQTGSSSQSDSGSRGGGGGGSHELKTRKIFVGGISPASHETAFRDYFKQFGKVEDVMLMVDKETGKSRGFGFVTFETEEAVERAVEKKMHDVDGKSNVEVKKAEPKGYRPTPAPARGPPRDNSYVAVPYSGGYGAIGYERGYGGYVGGYNDGFGSSYASFDGYSASLYAAGPGAALGYGSYGGVGLNVAYGSPPSPLRSSRDPGPYGAIGSGYQDPYYGSAGAADIADEYGHPSNISARSEYGEFSNQQGHSPTYNNNYGNGSQGRSSSRYQPYGRT